MAISCFMILFQRPSLCWTQQGYRWCCSSLHSDSPLVRPHQPENMWDHDHHGHDANMGCLKSVISVQCWIELTAMECLLLGNGGTSSRSPNESPISPDIKKLRTKWIQNLSPFMIFFKIFKCDLTFLFFSIVICHLKAASYTWKFNSMLTKIHKKNINWRKGKLNFVLPIVTHSRKMNENPNFLEPSWIGNSLSQGSLTPVSQRLRSFPPGPALPPICQTPISVTLSLVIIVITNLRIVAPFSPSFFSSFSSA